MNAPRRNEVIAIAGPRPRLETLSRFDLVGWLNVPLTPARAARLADFELRHGVNAQTLILDLLDDAIFDVSSTSHDALPAPSRGQSTNRE